ncbi:hypothetical protein [Paenibacillus dendritiformis]|uniref:hypothetical protein n=1 Tax=Paenibacillus dendritiformis TaxID=130049 RepID=UPI00387E0756
MPYEAKTDWKYDDLVTEKDMNRIEQGLKDAHVPAYQPLTLNPGLQVVEVENDTPFRMGEVKGRTLVNLLGRAGACDNAELWTDYQTTHTIDQTLCVSPKGASGGSAVTKTKVLFEAEKFYLLIGKAKVGTATTASLSVSGYMEDTKTQAASNKEFQVLYKAIANFSTPDTRGINANVIGGDGVTAYFDDVRLYEISQAEYEIIVNMTPEQVAAKYPYVDGITNVTNPFSIVTGGNLLPPFYDGWYALTETHLMLISPYEAVMQISTSAQTGIHIPAFPVLPNTDYTYSAEHNAGLNIFGVESGTALVSNFKGSQVTFNTGNNTRINVAFVNGESAGGTPGTYSIKNPILTVGTEPKPFARQQRSTLGFETELAAHPVDGSNPDTLFMGDDGLPYVLEKWGKLHFDELPVSALSVGGGDGSFKQINLRRVMKNPVYKTQIAVKFDGTMLVPSTEVLKSADGLYIGDNYIDINNVYITVRNTDSGWGPDYTPEPDEIKAYFLGWKMYDNIHPDNPHNGAGKAWIKITCRGTDGRWSSAPPDARLTTPVDPAGIDSNGRVYTPYRLQYQKTKPTVEPVRNYELGATLTAGSNMVEVGSGIVIREKANPVYYSPNGNYYINNTGVSGSLLKNKVSLISRVYRNDQVDSFAKIENDANAYGKQHIRFLSSDFDPTAVYHVTYTMLDPTLAAPFNGTVAANLRGTVLDLVQTLRSFESGMSGDVALTAADVGAATKAEFDDLKKNAVVKNGDSVTISAPTILINGENNFINGYTAMNKTTVFNDMVAAMLTGGGTPGNQKTAIFEFKPEGPIGARAGWIGMGDPGNPYNVGFGCDVGHMNFYAGKSLTLQAPEGVWANGRNLLGEIDNLKQSGVDAKQQVVDAINSMGGSASTNDPWAVLAQKIREIQQGFPTYLLRNDRYYAGYGHGATAVFRHGWTQGYVIGDITRPGTDVPGNANVTIQPDNGYVALQVSKDRYPGQAQAVTSQPVDLTNVDLIEVSFMIGSSTRKDGLQATLGVSTVMRPGWEREGAKILYDASFRADLGLEYNTICLNVSALRGAFYVGVDIVQNYFETYTDPIRLGAVRLIQGG